MKDSPLTLNKFLNKSSGVVHSITPEKPEKIKEFQENFLRKALDAFEMGSVGIQKEPLEKLWGMFRRNI